jgi:phage-related protein
MKIKVHASHYAGVTNEIKQYSTTIEYPSTPTVGTYLIFGDAHVQINAVGFNIDQHQFEVRCLVKGSYVIKVLVEEFSFVEQAPPATP